MFRLSIIIEYFCWIEKKSMFFCRSLLLLFYSRYSYSTFNFLWSIVSFRFLLYVKLLVRSEALQALNACISLLNQFTVQRVENISFQIWKYEKLSDEFAFFSLRAYNKLLTHVEWHLLTKKKSTNGRRRGRTRQEFNEFFHTK